MLKTAAKVSANVIPGLRAEARRLYELDFNAAHFVADNLEEDIAPRLEVLQELLK